MFHHALLNGAHDEDLIHGLLSVVFWGFASGTDGRVNSMRALSRSRAILSGRKNVIPQNAEQIVEYLRKTRGLLEASCIADALREAQKIKFLGMAFASKVLAFISPSIAAVGPSAIPAKKEISVCQAYSARQK
jgi:hypothetical protein